MRSTKPPVLSRDEGVWGRFTELLYIVAGVEMIAEEQVQRGVGRKAKTERLGVVRIDIKWS